MYLEISQKIMRLTKRDIALTKISIPAAIHSVYFRGKRYSYNDYLEILKQADKNKISKNWKNQIHALILQIKILTHVFK